MALSDDLRAAKALIDTPEKWGKGRYEPRPGCYCIRGAIIRLHLSHDDDRRVCRALQAELPDGWVGLPSYNDFDTTTHADIMALFQRAIDAAEAASAATLTEQSNDQ